MTGQGRDDHPDRDLGADDQDGLWLGEGGADLGRADLVVGAGGDRDDVLARVVDRDHGQPGRGVRRDADAVVTDSLITQGGQEAAAEVVAADAARHAHLGAEPGRRHRLVGPLPAGREPGRRAEHGRAGFGQPGHGDGDIHVQAAQDGDLRPVSHALSHPLSHSRTVACRGSPYQEGPAGRELALPPRLQGS